MPEKTVKRGLQNAGCKIVTLSRLRRWPDFHDCRQAGRSAQALHPEGTQNAELKNQALRLARELLRETKYEKT
jgi:hypothetical protein